MVIVGNLKVWKVMEYQRNVFYLKPTDDGKVTRDSGNPFDVNYSGDVRNVLILAPIGDRTKVISALVSRLPLENDYKVVVDMNDNPDFDKYEKYKIDVVIDAHGDDSIEDEFKDSEYIGQGELRFSDYNTLLRDIDNKLNRRSLENKVNMGEAV